MTDSRNIVAISPVASDRLSDLLELFATTWWTARREPAAIAQMLTSTDVTLGLLDAVSERLVGFARAITDRTFLAVVLDVIVDPRYRGTGLGERLMGELLGHRDLAEVESIELVCQPELIGFYRRWGFTESVGRSLLMRRTSNPLLLARPLGG